MFVDVPCFCGALGCITRVILLDTYMIDHTMSRTLSTYKVSCMPVTRAQGRILLWRQDIWFLFRAEHF